MAEKIKVRCTNIGNCLLADSGEVVEVESLAAYDCPFRTEEYCELKVAGDKAPPPPPPSRWIVLAGLALFAVASAVALALWLGGEPAAACAPGDVTKLRTASALVERSADCFETARKTGELEPAVSAATALERAAAMAGAHQDAAQQRLGDLYAPGERVGTGAFAGFARLPAADRNRAARAYALCADTSAACAAGLEATKVTTIPTTRLMTAVGSNTIGESLLPALVAAYLKSRGATDIAVSEAGKDQRRVTAMLRGRSVDVMIAAPGSSKAFEALRAGTADLGASSRRESAADIAAGTPDLRNPNTEFVIGLDSVVIVVHPRNPLQSLSVDQVAGLFAGDVADWSAVGGAAGPVRLHRRDDVSGTTDTFRKVVMRDRDFVPGARTHSSSGELTAAIAADPAAVGYVGGGFGRSDRVLSISAGGPAFPPEAYYVRKHEYPLSRQLYLYVPAAPKSAYARELIAFALSDAGQAIVAQQAFIPVDLRGIEAPTSGPEATTIATAGPRQIGRCVALDRRFQPLAQVATFETASERLDGFSIQTLEAEAVAELRRMGAAPDAVQLIGYTDDVGDPDRERARSYARAKTVAAVLRRGGFRPLITGCGKENPIGDNSSDAGREKNRRVEIYYVPATVR